MHLKQPLTIWFQASSLVIQNETKPQEQHLASVEQTPSRRWLNRRLADRGQLVIRQAGEEASAGESASVATRGACRWCSARQCAARQPQARPREQATVSWPQSSPPRRTSRCTRALMRPPVIRRDHRRQKARRRDRPLGKAQCPRSAQESIHYHAPVALRRQLYRLVSDCYIGRFGKLLSSLAYRRRRGDPL